MRELKDKEKPEPKPGSLAKYLNKGDDGDSGEDLVPCSECGRMVSPFSLPEHMDYHFARSLARETPGAGREGFKRKREGDGEVKKEKKRNSDISKFFSKK